MNQLKLIIKNEYITDVRAKSFWISTFLVPIIMVLFGVVVALLMDDSDAMRKVGEVSSMQSEDSELTGRQVFGMLIGMMLTIFLTVYGSQIFNKVKVEKTNRIIEVMATCVTGRTMMLGKIISVGLVGITQLLLWSIVIVLFSALLLLVFSPMLDFAALLRPDILCGLGWGVLYFIGGYIFFGSLFAAAGAMTDRNNENQEYISVITIVMMLSLYIGIYAVDNGDSTLSLICSFIPLTSPTVATVNSVSGAFSWWQSLLALLTLYLFAGMTLAFSGKLYTSSMLLTGKKLSPKDIIVFLKSK